MAECAHAEVESLEARQPLFARSGGSHAAALVDAAGCLLCVREDVGRHNAVDKVVGALLLEGALERACVLAVSGRVSFEIVQKAAVARIPVVVGISAPTSMAIDVAQRAGITLVGFARDDGCSIYCHEERLLI
jgi:FdhD protein